MERYGIDDRENFDSDKSDKGKPPRMEDIDWDPALRIVNRNYDRLAAALRQKDRALRQRELAAIGTELEAIATKARAMKTRLQLFLGGRRAARLRGELLGTITTGLLVPSLCNGDRSLERGGQIADNVSVAFALAWYRRDHGRYPAKLEALAPKYLVKVPGDRFSGEALIYRPAGKGYLFYSVGVNGADNGGRTYSDDPPDDDLPVRMPLPGLQQK